MTPSSPEPTTWLVTGASRGLGAAIAGAAATRGHTVIATARDPEALAPLVARHGTDAIIPRALDVTDAAAIADVVASSPPIGVLVNNAGYGLIGALEDVAEDDLAHAFATNLHGPLRLTRAVLPGMRARRRGHIVQISSVIGVTSGLGGGAYAGPKAALEAMSEALAAEVAPLGIDVTIVEPGAFRTDFSGPSLRVAEPSPDYAELVGPPTRAFRAGHGTQAGDPARAAAAIVAAVERGDGPLRLPLGDDAFTWLAAYLQARLDGVAAARPLAGDTAFAPAS